MRRRWSYVAGRGRTRGVSSGVPAESSHGMARKTSDVRSLHYLLALAREEALPHAQDHAKKGSGAILHRFGENAVLLERGDLLTFLLSDGKLSGVPAPDPTPTPAAPTLREIVDRYLATLGDGTVEANSLATTRMHLNHFLLLQQHFALRCSWIRENSALPYWTECSNSHEFGYKCGCRIAQIRRRLPTRLAQDNRLAGTVLASRGKPAFGMGVPIPSVEQSSNSLT